MVEQIDGLADQVKCTVLGDVVMLAPSLYTLLEAADALSRDVDHCARLGAAILPCDAVGDAERQVDGDEALLGDFFAKFEPLAPEGEISISVR